MSCPCDGSGECMCPDWRRHTPESFADAIASIRPVHTFPTSECHEARCRVFPELCICRKYPNRAEPGWHQT